MYLYVRVIQYCLFQILIFDFGIAPTVRYYSFFIWLYKHHGLIFASQMKKWSAYTDIHFDVANCMHINVVGQSDCQMWFGYCDWIFIFDTKATQNVCCILKTCVGVCTNSEYSAIITSSTILRHLLINNIFMGKCNLISYRTNEHVRGRFRLLCGGGSVYFTNEIIPLLYSICYRSQ